MIEVLLCRGCGGQRRRYDAHPGFKRSNHCHSVGLPVEAGKRREKPLLALRDICGRRSPGSTLIPKDGARRSLSQTGLTGETL